MDIIKKPAPVDLNLYDRNVESPQTRYGLPADVQFCKKCVISNQRPSSSVEFKSKADTAKQTIRFDKDGNCDACRVAEVKAEIDWTVREQELRELCDLHRRHDGGYDCVVPGSGGKDSFYASHVLKHEYGMHPLTVTWAPHIYTEWGWRNFQRWIHTGFDNQLLTPNGRVHRLLTRLAMDVLLHPFQAFIIGQKSIAARVSTELGIPLVFYGENEAEYGNAKADMNSSKRDKSFFSSDDGMDIVLGGVAVGDLVEYFGLELADIAPYVPASPEALDKTGTEVHYLGYYLKWHPQSCYYYAQQHGGFEPSPERTSGTYSKYNSIDDRIDDLHYYTTLIKYGIGRATYDAAQEIRSDDIDRDEGIALVRRFDTEYPERFLDELLAYLSIPEHEFPEASKMFEQPVMDRHYFDTLCDSFRSPHLWVHENGTWMLRHAVHYQV